MRTSVALVLGLIAGVASAEQFVEQDGYRVHYAALPTIDLAPAVAQAFGVSRSRHRALIVLNAQQIDGDTTRPVAATGSGRVRNLIGHTQALELRAEQEGVVHYLLADFEVVNREWIVFEVDVRPDGADAPLAIRFKQQFWTD